MFRAQGQAILELQVGLTTTLCLGPTVVLGAWPLSWAPGHLCRTLRHASVLLVKKRVAGHRLARAPGIIAVSTMQIHKK